MNNTPSSSLVETPFAARLVRITRQLWWSRYAILTVVSPLLIVIAARKLPSLLRGLLLLRLEQHDAAWLTWMSGMVVALGLAIVRIIDLHGAARMAISQAAGRCDSDGVDGALKRSAWLWRPESMGWPLLPVMIWFVVMLSYPVAAAHETIQDLCANQAGETEALVLWRIAVMDIVVGALLATLSLFVLFLLRTLVVGRYSAASGMFLGEGMATWIVGKFRPLAHRRRPMFRFPIHLDGITQRQSKKMLPGHPQLLIALLVSSAVYLSWYFRSTNDVTWAPHGWPVGFYLLLLIYCSSAVFSFLTFVMDRYHVPVVLAAIAYVALFSDAHRFFELSPDESSLDITLVDNGSEHLLMRAIAERPENNDYMEPPYLDELYGIDQNHFVLPRWPDGKRTLVVVTASGGGIQAAAWTSRVLTGLEERFPVLAESIGLISCVSGGSVGVMHYLAHRQPRKNDPQASHWSPSSPDKLSLINVHSRASSLEAVGWGLAFPDFARTVFPIPLNQKLDRGWALEASWWNRIGPTASSANVMKHVRIRDLIGPIRRGELPPVIFNATAVETGQRVLISPIRAAASRSEEPADYRRINAPIDFLDFYGAAFKEPSMVNPRLTTAVRLSATFAYVTPVARPLQSNEGAVKTEFAERLDMHLCDGGYSDNTGLVSAIRIVQELVTRYRARMRRDEDFQPPFDRIIFVRIEPFPPNAAKIVRDNSGLNGALLGPLTAITATRISTQAERADLELSLLMDVSSSDLLSSQEQLAIDLQLETKREALRALIARTTIDRDKHPRLQQAIEALKAMPTSEEPSAIDFEIQRMHAEMEGMSELPNDSPILPLANLVNSFESLRQRKAALDAAERSQIEIKTALFRFDTRALPRPRSRPDQGMTRSNQEPSKSRSYYPPLSWRLAQTDINALEIAWQRYTHAFDGAGRVKTTTTDEDPSTPWRSGNRSLQSATLHPNDLRQMSLPQR